MPQFHWSGRTRNGQTASGTIDAPSKEAAVNALRAQNVMVTSISTREGAGSSGVGQRLARVVLGLALLGGATLMGMISKGARIQCARSGAAYDCTIDTTMAGIRTLYTENTRGARSVTVETHVGRGKRATKSSRLVFTGDARPLATEWMQSVMPASEHVAREINQAFAQQKASVDAWQIEAAPAAVALILGIIGLWILMRSLRPA
jgi:hypothetical protein